MNPNDSQPTSFSRSVIQPTSSQQPNEKPASNPTGLAVASLVLSIVGLLTAWIFGIGILLAIVALVLGIVSLVKKRGGKGMSIAGIIISAITLLMGIILIPIAIVAYNGIQERAKEATTQSSIAKEKSIESTAPNQKISPEAVASQVQSKAQAFEAMKGFFANYRQLTENNDASPEATLSPELASMVNDGGKSSITSSNPVAYKGCIDGASVFYYDAPTNSVKGYTIGVSGCGF